MIIIRLIGGLGNQLFQYAAGRALSLHHNTALKIDISNYFFDFRTYELNHFCIRGEIAHFSDLFQFSKYNAFIGALFNYTNFHQSDYLKKIFKKMEEVRDNVVTRQYHQDSQDLKPHLINGRYLAERFLHYDTEFEQAPNDAYVMGYYQSEKYFKEYESEIRKEFRFRNNVKNSIASEIINSNSVSIHIRRGDKNVQNSNYYSTDLGYIQKAITIIKTKIENPCFFIFSDDLEWVKRNLHLDDSHRYVTSLRSFEDLELMSLCKHNIIAESSFSWWGGWLNTYIDKIVIAPNPNRWNKLFSDTQDIYPSEWLIIETW